MHKITLWHGTGHVWLEVPTEKAIQIAEAIQTGSMKFLQVTGPDATTMVNIRLVTNLRIEPPLPVPPY